MLTSQPTWSVTMTKIKTKNAIDFHHHQEDGGGVELLQVGGGGVTRAVDVPYDQMLELAARLQREHAKAVEDGRTQPAALPDRREAGTKGKEALRRARARWGSGWSLLSQDQREAYVGYEIAMLMLGQCESIVVADSPLGRLQAAGRAAFEELAAQ